MKKIKTTKKQLKNAYNNIISIGYCNAYYLLAGLEPHYYCSRIEGWACDNYHYNNNVLISTGYSPISGIYPKYEITKKYNDKAREIYNSYEMDYNKRIKKINALLDKFIVEALNHE